MSAVSSLVRAERVKLPTGLSTWTVVGSDHLPIPEVDEWLDYLRGQGQSPNTVASYASHVGLLLRWLGLRSSSWETLTFPELSLFLADLADGSIPLRGRRPAMPRRPTTSKAVMAGITSFLEYWRLEDRGPADLRLFREARHTSRRTDHVLSHIEHKRQRYESRVSIRGGNTRPPIVIINFETDFKKLLAAAHTARDKLLLSLLYDGGLRIGQSTGLRHSDLDPATLQVTVERRTDNVNEALSKQRSTFVVQLPRRTFTLYSKYLIEEQLATGIESDYVLTNLRPPIGRPIGVDNARKLVEQIGRRAGVKLTPHTLRHTHATLLAKLGWTAPEIAARLGHSVASSADVYIHLASTDLEDKLKVTEADLWPEAGAL
jgi:integrase